MQATSNNKTNTEISCFKHVLIRTQLVRVYVNVISDAAATATVAKLAHSQAATADSDGPNVEKTIDKRDKHRLQTVS